MKKVISILIISFCISTLAACNSPEDIKPISQKDMIKYVEKAIGEGISFVSVESNEMYYGIKKYKNLLHGGYNGKI